MLRDDYSPWDLAEYDDPNDEPVCVCADYAGTTAVTFCHACKMWTDDAELLAEIAPEIPAPALIETPVYVFTDPMFYSQEEAA